MDLKRRALSSKVAVSAKGGRGEIPMSSNNLLDASSRDFSRVVSEFFKYQSHFGTSHHVCRTNVVENALHTLQRDVVGMAESGSLDNVLLKAAWKFLRIAVKREQGS